MNNKLFVGNLSFSVSEDELRDVFSQYGEVASTALPKDRETGRPRGFAFVEMGSQSAAEAARKGLDGRDLAGREMRVNFSEAKPRTGSRY